MRVGAKKRSEFRHFHEITTRWMDNDAYGHVNNVVYYSWFDTVVNQFLITNGVLDIEQGAVIGLVVETQCNYFASVAFPERVTAGLCVTKLGNSSVRYEVSIFREDEETASAHGHFVHVYVDRATRKPTSIPDEMRILLQSICVRGNSND
jgi:acyl-CoA thioester hydrolase